MARKFGTGNYLEATTFAPLATPFSWSAWIYPTQLPSVTGDEHNYFFLSDASFSDFYSLRGDDGSTDKLQFNRRALTGTTQSAQTANSLRLNQWNHIFGRTKSSTDALALLNGDAGNAGTSTTSVSPVGVNNFKIGASVSTDYLFGYMAFPMMWDVGLEIEEGVALARGIKPRLIRPRNIVHDWRLRERDGGKAVDSAYSHTHLDVVGTVRGAGDPPFGRIHFLDLRRHAFAAGGGQTVVIGQAVETDTAGALSWVKSKAVGQAVETDTGFPLGRAKAKSTGLASETDTGFALGRSKAKQIGQAIETDTAFPVSLGGQVVAIGQAVEADTAFGFSFSKAKAIGLAVETDTGLSFGILKARSVGLATETDTALVLTHARGFTIGQAIETDSAFAVGRAKAKQIGQALETDIAFALVTSGAITASLLCASIEIEPAVGGAVTIVPAVTGTVDIEDC